jgi:phospholipase/lecithinase/hemolysin
MNFSARVFLSLCASFTFVQSALANLNDPRIAERAHVLKDITTALEPTKRIFVIGDSLSDSDKRLQSQSKGSVPPFNLYWNGHFTNGPTWNEYIASALDIPSYSYAVAGTRIAEVNNYYILPPTMKHLWSDNAYAQIKQLDADKVRFSSQDLVAVWVGGNDYLLFPDEKKIDSLVWHTRNIVNQLRRRGAKRFILFNVPDVTLTPWHSLHLADIIMPAKKVKPLVVEHNNKLKLMVDRLRQDIPEVKITYVDIYSALNQVFERRELLELSNSKNPCIGGEFLPKGIHPSFMSVQGLPQIQCQEPESYFYWDPWHPTTKVHCLTAVKVLETLMNDQVISTFDFEATLKKCLLEGLPRTSHTSQIPAH